MFFIITEVAFLDLTLPTSKYPKPICMTTICNYFNSRRSLKIQDVLTADENPKCKEVKFVKNEVYFLDLII
jgi:hypothetical protein